MPDLHCKFIQDEVLCVFSQHSIRALDLQIVLRSSS